MVGANASVAVDDLKSADRIVVLASDGRITDQGSYAQLAGSLSFDTTKTAIDVPASATVGVSPERTAPPGSTAKSSAPKPPSSDKDKARRTGDLKCYAAYGRSMGLIRALIFLLIAVAFAFTSKFSRMYLRAVYNPICQY